MCRREALSNKWQGNSCWVDAALTLWETMQRWLLISRDQSSELRVPPLQLPADCTLKLGAGAKLSVVSNLGQALREWWQLRVAEIVATEGELDVAALTQRLMATRDAAPRVPAAHLRQPQPEAHGGCVAEGAAGGDGEDGGNGPCTRGLHTAGACFISPRWVYAQVCGIAVRQAVTLAARPRQLRNINRIERSRADGCRGRLLCIAPSQGQPAAQAEAPASLPHCKQSSRFLE